MIKIVILLIKIYLQSAHNIFFEISGFNFKSTFLTPLSSSGEDRMACVGWNLELNPNRLDFGRVPGFSRLGGNMKGSSFKNTEIQFAHDFFLFL